MHILLPILVGYIVSIIIRQALQDHSFKHNCRHHLEEFAYIAEYSEDIFICKKCSKIYLLDRNTNEFVTLHSKLGKPDKRK